jgi:hypothetical protein
MARQRETKLSQRRLHRRLKAEKLLRGPKGEWDFLHLAEAYTARHQRRGDVSLNDFAVEHGALASALYEETKDHNMVLWHGTSVSRVEKILEHGFAHYRGVWMALKTSTPLEFARNRAAESEGRPAILISVIDLELFRSGVHFDSGAEVRFRHDVPPDVVQYMLTDRDFRCVGGGRVRGHRLPAKAKFVHKEGRWVVPTQNPARFDAQQGLTYTTASEWLDLKLSRLFTDHGRATRLEAFCSVYANCTPTAAVPRETVLDWLGSNCGIVAQSRWGPVLRMTAKG